MTFEQVMALQGIFLSDAVARKMGKFEEYLNQGVVPNFAGNWDAAMQIRKWVNGLDKFDRAYFPIAVKDVMRARTGYGYAYLNRNLILDIEPVDIARAALLLGRG